MDYRHGTGLAKISDAATYLQVSRTKIYRLMRTGELPYVMIGHRRRIPWLALHSLASSGTPEGDPQGVDPRES